MPRQEPPPAPSEREMDILKVFWEVGEVPVRVVHQKMAPNGEFALTTIQTLIRIMAEKGFLQVRNVNRTLYYKPCYTAEQASSRFLHKVFDGEVDRLVLSMLRAENLSAEELREIETLIAKMRKGIGHRGSKKEVFHFSHLRPMPYAQWFPVKSYVFRLSLFSNL